MNPLHPYYFRRTLYGLRGGFLIRPLAISLALGAMGGVLPRIEFNPYVSKVLYATPIVVFKEIQPNLAISILSSIAAGVMTVVSIVFAILLMSLTLASMQFSPRILIGFTKDRVTQWTLGVFLGTFSYLRVRTSLRSATIRTRLCRCLQLRARWRSRWSRWSG